MDPPHINNQVLYNQQSIGDSPSGKARGSGPRIRGFESLIPSQAKTRKHSCLRVFALFGGQFERPSEAFGVRTARWQFARKSSDESYAFNREVSGSRNVTRIPHTQP